MIYIKLFLAFLKVGLLSIGGGYAALPLIQEAVVDSNQWLTLSEFADVVTISQMTPGPISINSATFVGMRTAGFWGAVVATLGCVFPSFILVIILAIIYRKYKKLDLVQGVLDGLRPSSVGLIASAGLSMVILTLFNGDHIQINSGGINLLPLLIISAGVLILRKAKISPTILILITGVAAGLLSSVIG